MKVKKFVFSPFQENTYLLINESNECWILDPGCYFPEEKTELKAFIEENNLNPTRLINTHCHLDHVFGNHFVHETFGLSPEYHKLDEPTMLLAPKAASMYGVPGFMVSPPAKSHLDESMKLSFGKHSFDIVFVPGHAPGHIALIEHNQKIILGGDVLFQRSIGRTDLLGGDHDTLIESIKSKFFTLGNDYLVYSGHGPETTIGEEKKHNPYIN